MAPIHYRGPIGEHVMQCQISPKLFWWINKLIYNLDSLGMSTFSANFHFGVNYFFKKQFPEEMCKNLHKKIVCNEKKHFRPQSCRYDTEHAVSCFLLAMFENQYIMQTWLDFFDPIAVSNGYRWLNTSKKN